MNDFKPELESLENAELYADAQDMPIGESDDYLVSMVNSVKTNANVKRGKLRRAKADPAVQTSHRARLLASQK